MDSFTESARELSSDVWFSETTQDAHLTSEMIRKLKIVRKQFLKGLATEWSRPLRLFVIFFTLSTTVYYVFHKLMNNI